VEPRQKSNIKIEKLIGYGKIYEIGKKQKWWHANAKAKAEDSAISVGKLSVQPKQSKKNHPNLWILRKIDCLTTILSIVII
jgi:hypothetical protein